MDVEFDRVLTRAAGNEVSTLMLESIADLGQESRLATIATVGWKVAHQHQAVILDSIEKHDPIGAAKAMTRHLELACSDLQQLFLPG